MLTNLDNICMETFKNFFKANGWWLTWLLLAVTAVSAAFYIISANNHFYQEYIVNIGELSKVTGFVPVSRVTIDFGGGVKRAFEGRVIQNMPASYILTAISEAGKFKIALTKDKKRIMAVDTVFNTAKKKWTLYLSGRDEPVEDISFEIHPRDNLTLIYR